MKIKIIILTSLICLLSSCDDIDFRYYTKLNADGSITKRIVAVGDSAKVHGNPFSFDVDNGWDVSYDTEIDAENGDTLHLAVAVKVFLTIDELNNGLCITEGDSVNKDKIIVKREEQFRWFFTFHEYSETFVQIFPFRDVSINDFISDEEQRYLFEGDTTCMTGLSNLEQKSLDEETEKKFLAFISQSLTNEYLNIINNHHHWSPSIVLTGEDSLFVNQVFKGLLESEPELDDVCQLLDKRLGSDQILTFYNEGHFNRFEKQIEDELLLLDGSNYNVQIEVPDLLYGTNATFIKENVAKWQFKRGRYLYKDYTLFVKYRTINLWAVISTFCLVTILMVLLYIRNKKS